MRFLVLHEVDDVDCGSRAARKMGISRLAEPRGGCGRDTRAGYQSLAAYAVDRVLSFGGEIVR